MHTGCGWLTFGPSCVYVSTLMHAHWVWPVYLWPVRFPGVGSIQLSEDTLVLGLQGLLSVDMIYLGLSTPEDQDHGAGIHSWGPRRPRITHGFDAQVGSG